MNVTNPSEPSSLDALLNSAQSLVGQAFDGLVRLSQHLDQTFGPEVTTLLTVVLGLASLALALLPVYSAWRKPAARADAGEPEPAPVEIKRNALGEEIVQMHPECLQTLYGVPPAPPEPELKAAPAAAIAAAAAAAPVDEPAPGRRPEARNDVTLGLIADLSDALAQQQQALDTLSLQTSRQQQKIDLLVAQLKAQSSAFLLQGERLLHLESRVEPEPAEAAADTATEVSEETQRLSTFDQAIELAAQGVSAEALMARCGLSVSEARLVVLVHGKAIAGE